MICIEGRPSLTKMNAGFFVKKCFDNYHETTATRKKKKSEKQKNSKNSCKNNCENSSLPFSFYPFEVVFFKLAR